MTRDYVLELDAPANAPPVLSVFGGKITTYRRLAEAAMDRLGAYFPGLGRAWTADRPLAGGDLTTPNLEALSNKLKFDYPKLPSHLLEVLARRHGDGQLGYSTVLIRPRIWDQISAVVLQVAKWIT